MNLYKSCKQEDIVISPVNGLNSHVVKKYYDKDGQLRHKKTMKIPAKYASKEEYFQDMIENNGFTLREE